MTTWNKTTIKTLRENLGLGKAAFARALGVSRHTVRFWEQGKVEPRGPARMMLSTVEERLIEMKR